MNSGLISAWLTVTLFWTVVASVASRENIILMPLYLGWGLVVVLGASLIGFGGWYAFRSLSRQGEISDVVTGHADDRCSVNLGGFPQHAAPAMARKWDEGVFRSVINLDSYRKAYPAHADCLVAMLRVMATRPDLPASHVPGGHGGATLIQHSVNVVRAMHKTCQTWRFEGHKNRDGSFWHTVSGKDGKGYHAFDPKDPILPLAAFGHDIGKMICYEEDRRGGVREKMVVSFGFNGSELDSNKENRKKVPHDTEGARLIRRIPEFWRLPREDRAALLVAVGYYHKPGAIPASDWIDDRARSLTELLLTADVAAGMEEDGGVHPVEGGAGRVAPPVAVAPPATMGADSNIPAGAPAHHPPRPTLPPEAVAHPSASQGGEGWLSDSEYEIFLDVLLRHNAINGQNAKERIGFKHGDWVYVTDSLLRSALSKETGDPQYLAMPTNSMGVAQSGAMHPWSARLLKRLSDQGMLLQTFDGMEFSHKRAMYDTVSTVEGKTQKANRFVIIFSASILRTLEQLADCKSPPKIEKCSWGNHMALNKNKARAEPVAEPVAESATKDDGRSAMAALAAMNAFAAERGGEFGLEPSPPDLDYVGAEDGGPTPDAIEDTPAPMEDDIGYEDPVIDDELLGEVPDGDGAEPWNLVETLKRIARAEEPSDLKVLVRSGFAFFVHEEVVSKYGIEESDLVGTERAEGAADGKRLIRVRMED